MLYIYFHKNYLHIVIENMVKTKREFILGSCIVSTAALIVTLVSLATEEWVTSSVQNCGDLSGERSRIKFGLFGGYLSGLTGLSGHPPIEIKMTCLFDKNICALLCDTNKFEDYYNSDNPSEDISLSSCYFITYFDNRQLFNDNKSCAPNPSSLSNVTFINAGLWLSTIIFLIISIIFGIASAALGVWNTTSNPYQVYFSIFGLYIYNAIACFANLLAFVLWTVAFIKDLKTNIPTEATLSNQYISKGLAQLGYSYWINIIAIVFYVGSIAILYTRSLLISREPEVNVHIEEKNDGTMYLY